MIRRPPRSTQSRSSAASDVYKRQLQHAREDLVLSREDERKRLRRELHDGVGPTLAGIGLGLEAADNALPANLSRTQELLSDVRTDVAGLIEDVRRVVDGLRPPCLLYTSDAADDLLCVDL